MDRQEITDKIARLDDVLNTTPEGQAIQMGGAFYEACEGAGLISSDVQPLGQEPLYRGTRPILVLKDFPTWEFRIGPPYT